MAPQKRARRREDDEILAAESASSSLRPEAQRKKARLSNNQAFLKARPARNPSPSSNSSEDEEDDEEDDEELPDAEETPAPPPSTQYELLRDDGFKHLQNPDLDDQRATQKFLVRNQQIGDNHAANNAIIEEITCINFMCHDRLYVPLGPLINFVVGMNGSGKSAVLTAITLCLGGKASSTNRGASLKSLIKGGREQANLIVKLKNQGNDAYQPDVFGKSIIIERNFSRAGSSGFKLKTETGRLISSKRGDVEDIVEYYQLQVDNPMNVLTQDAAKTFITSSTPAQKYQFFVEGVQLKALDDDYRLVSDTCDQIDAKIEESKDDIRVLKKRYEDAKAKSDMAMQREGMRQQAKVLGMQLAWAQVEEQEAILVEREQRVAGVQEEIDAAESRAGIEDQKFQKAEEALDRTKELENRIKEELVPLKDDEESAKTAYDTASSEVQSAHTKQKEIGKSITAAQNKVKRFQDDINQEMQRMEDANGGAHSRKLDEIQKAEQSVSDATAALEQHNTEIARLEETRQQAKENLARMKTPLAAKRNEAEVAHERLSGLNSNRGNVMAGFDNNMPRVLQSIRNDGGFRERPIGPLGMHIKLLNPLWSNVLESNMSGALTSFIVTNKPDQMRLSNILRQHKMGWCQVAIVNHEPLNTTGHEPDSQYDTILRVLDIEDELIRKHLIISQGIDQSILVQNRSDGMKIMFDGSKPANVKQCFCINDQKRGWGHRLGYMGRQGQNREISPIKPPQGKPRMKTDIESQISYQTETLSQLERERNVLENEFRKVDEGLSRCGQTITARKRDHHRLKIALQQAQQRVDDLNAELDSFNVEDGRLDGLKLSLVEAEQEKRIYEDSYGNMALEKDNLNKKSAGEKRKLSAVRERIEEQETKLRKTQQRRRSLEEVRKMALSAKNLAITQIEVLRQEKERAQRRHAQQAEQVADFTNQATKICGRVPVDPGNTPASLDAQMNRIEQQLRIYQQRQGGTDKEIHDAAHEALSVYQAAKGSRQELLELLALLKQSFLRRIEMFRRFQSSISARSRINFNYLLSERAFRGKLTIDHKKKLLDVHVEPDETAKGSKGRQTRTLSGGEKSFSSICLLLSLWEAMGAPLRCLDEYDVFMDDVNRDVSTRMIISAARRSVGRQFILITPKALGSGANDGAADVKITKLTDPREKQRRIDEMMQDE